MASPLPSHLLTYSEVADVLRVRVRQVRVLVSAGLLAYTLIGTRKRRIPRESLERYLAARTFQNAHAAPLVPVGLIHPEVLGAVRPKPAAPAGLDPGAWNSDRNRRRRSTA